MTEPEVSTVLLESVSAAQLAAALQDCGFRAAIAYQGALPMINSAVQGLGFSVIFGGLVAGTSDRFADFSFLCWLNVQGELAPGVIEHWNQGKRFARLFTQPGREGAARSLVMMMDVLVAGGVSDRHLRAQCELWDRMTRDLVLHLKQPPATTAA